MFFTRMKYENMIWFKRMKNPTSPLTLCVHFLIKMSVIRTAGQIRLVASTLLHKNKKFSSQLPIARNAGSVLYRAYLSKEPVLHHYIGEATSFFLWYWILYHCYFEYDHLVPKHEFPDPSKFTDEELGIPPDDED